MIFKYLPNDIKNKIFNYNINKNSDIFLNSVIKYKKRQEEINIQENEEIQDADQELKNKILEWLWVWLSVI